MTPAERRATMGLSSIFGLRMLGMFIVLPVLALYAESLPGGGDRALIGLALGAYGLTQAVLQFPFGWASDRFGRRPVIAAGLIVFAAGSFLAAWAPTLPWIVAGRTLQGAGAISAAVIALAADLTRDEVRSRAMAAIGMTIGSTFAVSLVAGPALASSIGVPGLFALTGVLALLAMFGLRGLVPAEDEVAKPATQQPASRGLLAAVLRDPQLARLNYGIFALHAALMALFIEVPFLLRDQGVVAQSHWAVYLGVLVVSILLMMPALMQADRPGRGKTVFVGAIVVLLAGEAMLALAHTLPVTIAALVVFFAAFNLLEATLPSLVSKFAPREAKGTALGIYSSMQFLGAFVGAAAGGWLAQHQGPSAPFVLCLALAALWLAVSLTMAAPPALANSKLSMGET